jgi:putative flippase GtrA
MGYDRNTLRQLAKYSLVGGLTAAIYFSILLLTVELLHLGHVLAVSMSYTSAISFHFLANKMFTFGSRGGNVSREIFRYLCVALSNYLITLIVVYIVVDLAGGSTYLGVALSVAVTVGLGYGISRMWVFQHNRG